MSTPGIGRGRARTPDADADVRLSGSPLVLLLDVDGTLAPLVSHYALAAVPDETRAILAELATLEGVRIALVSGRAPADARRLVGIDGLWAAGNHGAEFLSPDGAARVHDLVAPWAAPLREASDEIASAIERLDGVLLENKVWTLSVHYRLASDAVEPGLRAELERITSAHGLALHGGKMIFEVRPPVRVHKGTAVLELADTLGAHAPGGSALFAGDDVTDEDAFAALREHIPRAVTVLVGEDRETAAEFVVPGTEAFRDLLARMLKRRRSR